jgi:hypothetical protein
MRINSVHYLALLEPDSKRAKSHGACEDDTKMQFESSEKDEKSNFQLVNKLEKFLIVVETEAR